MLQELQDFSWLNKYSFGQLEQIRKAIVERQMVKANALADKIRQDVDKNATIIQDIDKQIKQIDKMGLSLSDDYKKEIDQWRSWQRNINQLKQYNVNSATQLDTFRYFANKCGLDGSSSVEKKLNEWLGRFNDIVKEVPCKYQTQHSSYLSKQDLKNKLTAWKQTNEQRISEIYRMLRENNFDLYNQMFTDANWNTIYQKFTHAIMLSNWSIESAEILKRDSWKNLNNQQIIDEINKSTQNMYNLCYRLRQQQQQPFYLGSNHDINNGRITTTGAYGSPSRNH